MPSDAELDVKLTELLRVMVSRLPSNKTLPTTVVQQLLRGKYGDAYPEAYVDSHSQFITDTIMKLMSLRERAVAPAAVAAPKNGVGHVSTEDEDDDDDDDDDDDSSVSDEDSDNEEEEDDDEDEDEEEDEESSGSEDGEDEEESQDDDSKEEGTDGDTERLGKKRARGEEVDAIVSKAQQESGKAPSTVSVAERCKAMAECLRKLSYRVRAPTAEESLDEYLRGFLIAEFEKHNMDPEKYSKSDVKRYRIKREVDLLQQDGASLTLDRRNRTGRGFGNVTLNKEAGGGVSQAASSAPAASTRQTSMFLDDD